MGLEAATYIHQLNPSNPVGAVDPKAQGDDHLRMIKATLQATFPNINGAMTVSLANLNQWAGLNGAYAWTGQHSWSLALRAPDGAAATPAYTFANDLNTGIWRAGADQMRLTAGGVDIGIVGTTFFALRMPAQAVDGSAALPGFTFENDPDTGFYRAGSGNIRVSGNGALAFDIDVPNAYVRAFLPFHVPDGVAALPSLTFINDPDTGFYRYAPNIIGVSAGGGVRAYFADVYAQFDVPIYAPNGTAALPAYTFGTDLNTGMYRDASDQIGLSTNGVRRVAIFNGGVQSDVQQYAIDGTAAAPAYTFTGDADTGFYRIGADAIGFSEGTVGFRIGFRSIPRSTTVTTLAIGDVGKCVAITAAINIPASVFAAGDAVSIYNDSAGALNLTISAGTLRLGGTTSTGTRSIAPRGIATIWFNVGGATPEAIVSGSVS